MMNREEELAATGTGASSLRTVTPHTYSSTGYIGYIQRLPGGL